LSLFHFDNSKEWILGNYSALNKKRSGLVLNRLEQTPKNWEFQIAKRITDGQPLLYGRLGGIEASCLGIYLDSRSVYRNPVRFLQASILKPRRQLQLRKNAGVFPETQQSFDFFCDEHLVALQDMDIFSVWGKPMAWVEATVLGKSETLFVTGDASYPWMESRDEVSKHGWGMALNGKKILVISPFIDSFAVQVPKLPQVFSGVDYPQMEIEFLRAPMTQGGLDDGSSYKSHLLSLKYSMSSIHFDVALVSAGAYSLPLAHFAKKMGKIGIHAGGAMQLFFGVTGQRYDSYPQVTKFLNPAWKRPFDHERPLSWRSIENGCYW